MELTGIGGGLMLAVAAALWLVYLVPNWFKRREYLATERNAVRLQQTIRVLAETAEIPASVRAEQAARRLALEQRPDVLRGPVSVGRPVYKPKPSAEDVRALAARRLRRSRVLSSLLLLAALVIAIVQVALMLAVGAVVGSWVVLAIAAATVIGSSAMLSSLAEAARTRAVPEQPVQRRTSVGPVPHVVAPQRRVAEWTPTAVPKPLYLSRSLAPAAPARDASADVALAAVAAERALRAGQQTVVPVSRFASMGIVDDLQPTATPDLDAVLARRRAAG